MQAEATDAYPLVTVRVGVYNHALYLRECLDSIVGNTYPNLEIIIVNDASSDSSDEVIRAWLAEHPELEVRYILHEKNLGNTRSLNEAIRLAKGDFFCPIASDDIMLPDGIIDRVRYLQARPDKLAVFADCHVIDKEGRELYRSGIEDLYQEAGMQKRLLAIDALIPYNIVFHWAVPGPVFMCRMEAFNVVGLYDEGLRIEDWSMYLKLAARNSLGFLDRYVAKYRLHGSNAIYTLKNQEAELAKIARDASSLFRGANALRLYTRHWEFERDHAPSRLARAWRTLQVKPLLTLANKSYRLHRRMLVLRDLLERRLRQNVE